MSIYKKLREATKKIAKGKKPEPKTTGKGKPKPPKGVMGGEPPFEPTQKDWDEAYGERADLDGTPHG
jgi:hypothetical protein